MRQLGGVLSYNLSLLMPHLTGNGTPKQWLAGSFAVLVTVMRSLTEWIGLTEAQSRAPARSCEKFHPASRFTFRILRMNQITRFSTGC